MALTGKRGHGGTRSGLMAQSDRRVSREGVRTSRQVAPAPPTALGELLTFVRSGGRIFFGRSMSIRSDAAIASVG